MILGRIFYRWSIKSKQYVILYRSIRDGLFWELDKRDGATVIDGGMEKGHQIGWSVVFIDILKILTDQFIFFCL